MALFSTTAFAHSGHDHSHWLSDSIHLITIGAVLSVAAGAVYYVKRKKASKSIKD